MKRTVLLLLLLVAALPASAAELYIDLRTDYVAGTDFSMVRVQLFDQRDERRSWHTLRSAGTGDFLRGERVAELENVDRGVYFLSVELLDHLMRPVHGRIWIYHMGDRAEATVALIARP